MAFFYPIHHIGLVHFQNFPHATAADSAVVHFDRQFSGFFRVLMPLQVYGVIFAALLTLAALAPRSVIPRPDLVLYLSAFRASFPCLFCSFSHIFYFTIKSLFWTLPLTDPFQDNGCQDKTPAISPTYIEFAGCL